MTRNCCSRRKYLIAVGTSGLAGVAGCSGNNQPSSTTEETTEQNNSQPEENNRIVEPISGGDFTDVTSFRYNSQNTGHISTGATPSELTNYVLYRTNSSSTSLAQPLILDNIVYGTNDNELFAVDAYTGSKEWSYQESDEAAFSPLTISGNRIYFASRKSSSWGVNAVSTSTGDLEWRWEFSDGYVGFNPETSPTIVDGAICLTGRDYIFAIDTESGETRWASEADNIIVYNPVAAGVDETVYVGGLQSVLAMDTGDGSIKWRYDTGDDLHEPIVATDSLIYTTSANGKLYAIDRDTGEQVWNFNVGNGPTAPAVADDILVSAGAGTAYGIDPASGDEIWSLENRDTRTTPIVADETVYFGNTPGHVHQVDLYTGNWQSTIEVRMGTPVVVDGVLYAVDFSGRLRAFEQSEE